MVLSYDSYTETLEKQKEKDNDILEMKDQIQMIMTTLGQILGKQNNNNTRRSQLAKDLIEKGMYVNISK